MNARGVNARALWLALAMGVAACGDDADHGAGSEREEASTDASPAGRDAGRDRESADEAGSGAQSEDGARSSDAAADAVGDFPSALLPDDLLDSLELITPKPGGKAFFSDIVRLEPGDDVTYCTYVEGVTSELTYIHDTQGSQSRFGHHAILYYTTEPQEPGTRLCATHNESLRQLLGGTGGEGTSVWVPPPNVASEVPAGAQFVINHHWIHSGTEPIEVQAMMVTEPAAADVDLVIARSLAMVVSEFEVAPGASAEQTGECTLEDDMEMLSLLGHEHEWGTHVRAELVRSGGESEVIFDHDYDADMVAHPMVVSYDPDEPLQIRTGDTLRMHCEWHNDTEAALVWPAEMCVLFGWKIGGAGDAICFNGAWIAR